MTALSLWQRQRLGLSPRRSGRRGARLPSELPALEFWYDAAQSPVIEMGGVVERLDDLSGNANHASQSVAGERPLKTIDTAGRTVIRFDGSNDSLGVTTPPSFAAGVSVFMVFRMRARTDFTGVLSAALSAGTDHVDFFTFQNSSAASGLFQLLGRSTESNTLFWQPADDGGLIYAIIALGGGDASLRSRDGATTDTYDGSFGTPDEIILGARFASGVFGHAEVDLLEIGLYSQSLSDSHLDVLESYLKSKYTFDINFLLKEDGDAILLESGDKLSLE